MSKHRRNDLRMPLEYKMYLRSVKVGDTVYPCCDRKVDRATACEVVAKVGNKITVKGLLWDNDGLESTVTFVDGFSWVVCSEWLHDYVLQDPSRLVDSLPDEKLQELGLK